MMSKPIPVFGTTNNVGMLFGAIAFEGVESSKVYVVRTAVFASPCQDNGIVAYRADVDRKLRGLAIQSSRIVGADGEGRAGVDGRNDRRYAGGSNEQIVRCTNTTHVEVLIDSGIVDINLLVDTHAFLGCNGVHLESTPEGADVDRRANLRV